LKSNPEVTALLRESIEKHVQDVAEELFHWVEQLKKLDAGELPGSGTGAAAPDADAIQWPPRRRAAHPDEGSTQSPGKGA
jgi:hypothetical protein